MDYAAVEEAKEFIEHFGVKGQKCVVRRDKGHEGQKAKVSKIEKLDKQYDKNANSKNYFKVYNKAVQEANQKIIPEHNKDKRWAGKNLSDPKNRDLANQYYTEYSNKFTAVLNKHARTEIGSNASGTKHLAFSWDANTQAMPTWTIVDAEKMDHADADVSVDVTYDSNGMITSFHISGPIVHYGVKGQKWGVKKAVQRSSQSRAREKNWTEEYKKRGSMSDADLKRKLARLKLENEFKRNVVEARSNPRVREAKEWLQATSNMALSVSKIAGTGPTTVKAILNTVDAVKKR